MPDYLGQLNQIRARAQKSAEKIKTKAAETDLASEISTPEFMVIGTIGAVNDLCDWFGLDLILFRLADLVTAGILGLWCLFRLHKFPSARFGSTFLIELIPGLGDISPTWTLFILSVYLEQRGHLKTVTGLTKVFKAK